MGGLILVLALVGVFRFESAQSVGPSYDAVRVDLPAVSGTASPGQSYDFSVPVAFDNVTRLDFVLSAPSGTFSLVVKGPGGVSKSVEGAGKANVSFSFAAPTNGTVPPVSEGRGNWSVTVTLRASSPLPVTPPTAPVVGTSADVAFRVTPTATLYTIR